jgi:hypothetical protein
MVHQRATVILAPSQFEMISRLGNSMETSRFSVLLLISEVREGSLCMGCLGDLFDELFCLPEGFRDVVFSWYQKLTSGREAGASIDVSFQQRLSITCYPRWSPSRPMIHRNFSLEALVCLETVYNPSRKLLFL